MKRFLSLMAMVFVTAMLTGCTDTKREGFPDFVIFSTSMRDSASYSRAAAQCGLLKDALGIAFVPEPCPSGALAQLNLLRKGRAHLMAANAQDVMKAFRGEGPYKDMGKLPLRVLQVGGPNPAGLIVRKNSVVKTVSDLKDKRIVRLQTLPDLMMKSNAYLQANGLDPERDVRWIPANSIREGWEMVEVNLADAMCVSVNPSVQRGRVLKSAHDEKALSIARTFDESLNFVKLKGGALGVPEDTYVLSSNTVFVIAENASDEMAYQIVKASVENVEELTRKNGVFKGWTLEQAVTDAPAPYHNGAVRFYREKGVWTETQEAMQKEFLEMVQYARVQE